MSAGRVALAGLRRLFGPDRRPSAASTREDLNARHADELIDHAAQLFRTGRIDEAELEHRVERALEHAAARRLA